MGYYMQSRKSICLASRVYKKHVYHTDIGTDDLDRHPMQCDTESIHNGVRTKPNARKLVHVYMQKVNKVIENNQWSESS